MIYCVGLAWVEGGRGALERRMAGTPCGGGDRSLAPRSFWEQKMKATRKSVCSAARRHISGGENLTSVPSPLRFGIWSAGVRGEQRRVLRRRREEVERGFRSSGGEMHSP